MAAAPIRVCLVDDHRILCEGLAMLLAREPDIEVVAQCQTVAEGLAAAEAHPIDVLVLDLRLGGEDGFELLEQLRTKTFSGRVAILAAEVADDEVVRLAGLGVSGIILKNSPPESLTKFVRTIAAGEPSFSPVHLTALLRGLSGARAGDESVSFSSREKSILKALCQGQSNKEIAEKLQIRETSVKFSLQTMFRKTGVHTRSQLVRIALEQSLD